MDAVSSRICRLRRPAAVAAIGLAAALCAGCGRERSDLQGADALGVDDPQRRLLYFQIVEDPKKPEETAVLESTAFHYFLRLAATTDEERLRDMRTERATHRLMMGNPDSCRGHAVAVTGPLLEVRWADPPPGLGLERYEVLKGGIITQQGDYYELRLLVPKDDPDMEKLRNERVVRVAARFFKVHANKTAREGDKPFCLPLLVGPKPTDHGRDYPVYQEIAKRGEDDLFPFDRWPAPRTPCRTVLELRQDKSFAVDGKVVPEEAVVDALKAAWEAQKKDGADEPAAVIASARGLKWAEVTVLIPEAARKIRAAGFKRIDVKDESIWQDP